MTVKVDIAEFQARKKAQTSTILEELAKFQGCEIPTEDEYVRELIQLVIRTVPQDEWDKKFTPATCAHLGLSVKAKRNKKATPIPVDYEEKDIAEDEPAPKLETSEADSDDDIIPDDFDCEENYVPYHIEQILDKRAKNQLLVPEIQRNAVWPKAKKELFIVSCFKKVPIDPLTFFQEPGKDEFELGDGLQRVSTLEEFVRGEILFLSKTFAELSDKLQKRFMQRILKVDECKVERKHWPLIFRMKNNGGVPLNEHEGRRAFYITRSPYVKMIDTITSPNSQTGDTFLELFGGNNRFKGFGAVLRAKYLAENPGDYKAPMKTALDNYCEELLANPPKTSEINKERKKLDLIFQALKEKLSSQAFRFKGSRTNNLGLVDAMVYGGLLFQEAGITDVEDLGEALKDLRSRLITSKVVSANLKDDTSKAKSVIERLAATEKRVENIIRKVAE